jgi:hypothetical protein
MSCVGGIIGCAVATEQGKTADWSSWQHQPGPKPVHHLHCSSDCSHCRRYYTFRLSTEEVNAVCLHHLEPLAADATDPPELAVVSRAKVPDIRAVLLNCFVPYFSLSSRVQPTSSWLRDAFGQAATIFERITVLYST